MLVVKEVQYEYQDELFHFDLTVERGAVLSLMGPSGAGKSTLLSLLAGFIAPKSGEISVDGQPIMGLPPYKRPFSMLFQEHNLFAHLTVRENIELVLPTSQHYGIAELLAQVGLANQGEYYPRQLSGGMQRRVSIARAFATNPKLLLLDEPFNSLDAPTANRLRLLLIDLCKQRGTTVIFVTHDLSEAIYLADRILFMSNPPSTVIHQTLVKLPRPRKESGALELAWQAQLMTRFPGLLAGKID